MECTDDIGEYLYMCIKKLICIVCGKQGVIYNLGSENKISLCNAHKIKGLKEFERLHKVYELKVNV